MFKCLNAYVKQRWGGGGGGYEVKEFLFSPP